MLITETEKSAMSDLQSKYETYLTPSDALVKDMANLTGDIIILGAGGKMGPALATVAKQAVDRAGVDKKVIAISRSTRPPCRASSSTAPTTSSCAAAATTR